MLYVFTGNDTARAKAHARKLSKKAEVVLFGEGGESFEKVLSTLDSRGLFAPAISLILDRPFESSEGKILFTENADALHKSSTSVFVIVPKLSATEKKLFPKGADIQPFDVAGVKEMPRPNVFAFADVFLSGDRKKAWISYRKLISSGIFPEEIHGVLMWAIRSALLAAKTDSPAASGLKPFVFTKSKRVTEGLGIDHVEELSRSLIKLYHRVRAGKGNLELGMEYLILEKK